MMLIIVNLFNQVSLYQEISNMIYCLKFENYFIITNIFELYFQKYF